MDLNIIMEKSQAAILAIHEAKLALQSAESIVANMDARQREAESMVTLANQTYSKTLKDAAEYKAEFDTKIKSEREDAAKVKKEAEALAQDTDQKQAEVNKLLASVQQKEDTLAGKLIEIEAIKTEYEQKLAKVKTFVQSV